MNLYLANKKKGEETMEKTTFKVELEIEVAFDNFEGLASTPYTRCGAFVNLNKDVVEVFTDKGRIENAKVKKFERLN